jgi:carbon-monoxide dehydrogenase catalytic subunit
MSADKKKKGLLSAASDAEEMIQRASEEGIATAWSRLAAQEPQCGYCSMGLSCRNCAMGPCRVDPFGDGPQKGVCGAGADLIVARNLGRAIAAGSASHSDHGRDILEVFEATARGMTTGYAITDESKLFRLAGDFGIPTDSRPAADVARDLADALFEDFGTRRQRLGFVSRAPKKRQALWDALGITPRGIDRETAEMLHRTHMGVDSDPASVLLHGLRTGLSDGWGGSMIATELSDVLFGTPKPRRSQANLGTLKADQVNVALHGHNPVLSDVLVQTALDPQLLALAERHGARGINLVGLCCTGNEMLARRGVPKAGNHLMQELAIMTGALEAMVVDYQCIMPSLVEVARCFHTQIISTSDKARFPGAVHVSFDPSRGLEIARQILKRAVEAFPNRNPSRVRIPAEPVAMVAGFSVEAIESMLGGKLDPLVGAISDGKIRGIVGVVGCNNPKVPQDYGHVTLTSRLIENDVLVLVTGCAAVANGKARQMMPEAASSAGPGLRAFCRELGIPPVLHLGSCADNTRILVLAAALANHLGVDISQLPLAGAAPEWYSEKAIAIGAYVVASGIFTVLGVQPPIAGSRKVVNLLAKELEEVVGARFAVEPRPERAAALIRSHIEAKRKGLGLPHLALESVLTPEAGERRPACA